MRELERTALTCDGHEVVLAPNGREGLRELEREHPCVILLDLMMPVMNGWEFQRAIEKDPQLRTVPVIVVSAATAELTHQTDAAAYLPKPLDMDELLHVVGDFCSGRCAGIS